MKVVLNPTTLEIAQSFTDVTGADTVEVLTDTARGVVWINVNGICLLRICQIKQLVIQDARQP